MTVFEQVYQLVGSTEVDMYKMSVIEHLPNKNLVVIGSVFIFSRNFLSFGGNPLFLQKGN